MRPASRYNRRTRTQEDGMSGVVLVTGAGRGIGAAIARGAATRGYKVAINYSRSADAAKAVATEIARGGGTAIAVRADVAMESEVVEMFRTVDRELGKVTALVNNAGIMLSTPAASGAVPDVNAMLHTNVTG